MGGEGGLQDRGTLFFLSEAFVELAMAAVVPRAFFFAICRCIRLAEP